MNNHKDTSQILSGYKNISYGFLNKHSNQHAEKIAAQYKLSAIIMLKQVHSDIVHIISNYNKSLLEGDSLITNISGLGVGVYTADCVPILLLDPNKNIISAVHAGWRGTLLDITRNTVNRMKTHFNSDPKDIHAVIGPSIANCCYEVNDDVASKFVEKYSRTDSFIHRLSSSRYTLDLKKLNSMNLENCGIKNIEIMNECTKCDLNYYSYRREGKGVGRQLSFIGISNQAGGYNAHTYEFCGI